MQTPYQYCLKNDHYRCFENYAEIGFKFAHSVEELVVWTVEKEKVGYGMFNTYPFICLFYLFVCLFVYCLVACLLFV